MEEVWGSEEMVTESVEVGAVRSAGVEMREWLERL